jgi:riboflavin synthase
LITHGSNRRANHEGDRAMFTGLVEAIGRVDRIETKDAGVHAAISIPESIDAVALGESVSVNGCCLTVVDIKDRCFLVQIGPETLARTNLGSLTEGSRLNLERAIKAGDRLGGHIVQGHIDTTAEIRERRSEGEWEYFRFAIDPSWTNFMVPKGSIAIDGISLTLVDVRPDDFSIMLIPHTLAATTLGTKSPGDRVNVEVDVIAKYVQKLTAPFVESIRLYQP